MRICFLASTYPRFPGDGSGRFVQSLAEALYETGNEVVVLAPHHSSIQPLNSPVKVHHFRYIWPTRYEIMGYAQAMIGDRKLKPLSYVLAPLYYLFGLKKLMTLARHYHFEVMHVHWVIPNAPIAAAVARVMRIPLIISLHGSDIFFSRKNPILARISRRILKSATAVSACSPDLYQGAVQLGADPIRMHLIAWGADPSFFTTSEDVSQQRLQFGIPLGIPVILSMGRLVRKKGVEYLIRAFPQVLNFDNKVLLVIAGSGPEKKALQSLASALGIANSVRFLGEVPWDKAPEVMQLCDIFVVPSILDDQGNLDGLPTTILEAMSAGKPVVGSDISGIPLAVSDHITGLLVPPAEPNQLAQALRYLLSDPESIRNYGQAGRLRVESELNWRSVAEKFIHLYKQAIVIES